MSFMFSSFLTWDVLFFNIYFVFAPVTIPFSTVVETKSTLVGGSTSKTLGVLQNLNLYFSFHNSSYCTVLNDNVLFHSSSMKAPTIQ